MKKIYLTFALFCFFLSGAFPGKAQTHQIDLALVNPASPIGFVHFGRYEPTVWLKNYGPITDSVINLVCTISGVSYSDNVLELAPLHPNDSVLIRFDSVDLDSQSLFTIRYYIQTTTWVDTIKTNDTLNNLIYVWDPNQSPGRFVNGPLVNFPGAGAGGTHNSRVQAPLNSAGSNTNWANAGFGYRMADDFVVPQGNMAWQVDSIYVFTYQTGGNATNPSTITTVNARIWDGVPNAVGSNVVAGDTATNRMIRSFYSGINRTFETTPLDATRPIFTNVISFNNLILPPGKYWLDWTATGSIASGPWAPPITVLGISETGNGIQRVGGFVWQQQNGNTTILNRYQQGQPFDIFYTSSPLSVADQDLQNAKWSVYPNPSSGEVNVDFMLSKSSAVKVKLFDVMGREVAILADKNMSTGFNQLTWDASSLNTGIYILAVEMNGSLETKRLAISK